MKLGYSELGQEIAELGMQLLGRRAIGVDGPDTTEAQVVHDYLWSFQSTIAAGTSQIQRNLIAERILGMPQGPMTGAVLEGIRVLDYGRFIAAPWCSAILADMGADVIRVEKRDGGEDRWVQAVTDGGEGGTFLQCNRNKRSLTLDSTTPEGAEITRRLVAGADVVIANMPAAGMRASGLDYESLRAIKPDIILASATAYGEGGPDSDKVGFDGTGQVLSGATYRQGLPDQPIRTVVPYADFGTALTLDDRRADGAAATGERTGEGQHVEGALLPTALMMSNAFLIERDLLGVDKPRMGNRGTSVAPCDLYECADGWVLLQVAGQPMFKRWCRLVGREDLFDDPRFADDDLRWEHGDVLNDLMQDVVHRPDHGRGAGAARGGQAARPRRCTRPRTCSTTRTWRRWATCSGSRSRARPSRCRSSRRRSGCRPRPARSAPARRCSASTPTRSSPSSATTPSAIHDLRAREVI